jgi:dienelactone hydrolase
VLVVCCIVAVGACASGNGGTGDGVTSDNDGAGAATALVPAAVPANAGPIDGLTWYTVAISNGDLLVATIAPAAAPDDPVASEEPRPAVVVLPGSDGLRRIYLDLARGYAQAGFVAVVGCWFRLDTPAEADAIACPSAPAFSGANSDALEAVGALVSAARALPGVDGDRVGLVGHSRGATMALMYAAGDDGPDAVVSSSGTYASELDDAADAPVQPFVADLDVPVLIVHGTADHIASIDLTRAFEQQLRDAGGQVETLYVDGGSHALPFLPETAPTFLEASVTWLRSQLV